MDKQEFFRKLNIPFTSQQLEAITNASDRILLLAVPGSGKTTALIARLGYMIKVLGYDPREILTITYTVAATKDMQRRYEKFFGEAEAGNLEFRTINSLCAKILAEYGSRIGKKLFDLAEDKTVAGILTEVYRSVEDDFPQESDLQAVRTEIAYIKNRVLNENELRQYDEESDYHILDIYDRYQKKLRDSGLIDFDDQLVYARKILLSDKQTLEDYRRKYRHLCVDEAQDTSKIQHEIIELLAGGDGTLFMVGDEDQSIYGFRAAYPEALLSFEKNHPGAQVLLLEDNFRSVKQIVAAADNLIRNNKQRHEKHMRATREAGEEIRFIPIKARSAQYTYLLKALAEEKRQTAVLFRDNECALPLVDLFERNHVSYRFRGRDEAFFTHRIVRDIQSIIRFAYHQDDEELFMQIYYKLEFFLNKKEAMEACRLASALEIPITEAIGQISGLEFYKKKSAKAMRTHLSHLTEEDASSALRRIKNFMGYQDYLENKGFGTGKLEILAAIAKNVTTPLDFLARLDELREIVKAGGTSPDANIILSTIHSSKGLEYDRVYLLDVSDGILPINPRDVDAPLDSPLRKVFEEERRLFYVAVTRAKNELMVFQSIESLFVRELKTATGKEIREPKVFTPQEAMKRPVSKPYAVASPSKHVGSNDEEYKAFLSELGEGVIIEHKSLGEGVVVGLEDGKISISFEKGIKVFQPRFLFEHQTIRVKK